MFKKTIKFVDFNNVQRTEEHYFHLTKADVVQMELGAVGNSLTDYIKKIVEAEKGSELLVVLDEFFSKSYGVKSTDGRQFMKSPEIYAQFRSSEAYSSFFMELIENPSTLAEFFTELIKSGNSGTPQLSMSEQARLHSESLMQGRRAAQTPNLVKEQALPTVSAQDFQPATDMTTEQLEALLASKRAAEPQQ